jgi:hypothetical protein
LPFPFCFQGFGLSFRFAALMIDFFNRLDRFSLSVHHAQACRHSAAGCAACTVTNRGKNAPQGPNGPGLFQAVSDANGLQNALW